MENQNKLVLQRFLACAANRDRAGQAELLHDDIRVFEAQSLPFAGEHIGKEAFFTLVKRVFTQWDDVEMKTQQFIAEGDTVVLLATMHGRGRQRGESFSMAIAEVWRFRDGKIAAIQPYYYDTKRLLEW